MDSSQIDEELERQTRDARLPAHGEFEETQSLGEALNLTIVRVIRLSWRRRKIVFSIIGVGILISLLYALLLPNIYTSTTTLMPPDNTSPYSNIMSILSSAGPIASLGAGELGLQTQGDLFVSILRSRTVLDSLIARFDLLHYYKDRYVDDACKSLTADTDVSLDRKSGIITISVKARNPVLTSELAQGYVAELNRVVTEDSTSSARRERVFLEQRLKEVKQSLDDSSKALSQFATKSGAIDIPSQAKTMVDAGLKLQAELIDGRSELAALRQNYSEDNYRVRAAEARNSELQRQISVLGGRIPTTSSDGDASQSVYPPTAELPALGLTFNSLERKVRVEEALWEALTKQYEVAKVNEAREIPTVRVLDAADVPRRKSAPRRSLIMLVGVILSSMVACFLVLAVTKWDEMDPSEEPKKLLTEVAASLGSRLRSWASRSK